MPLIRRCALALAALAWATSAAAQSTVGCTVVVEPLEFGLYDAFANQPIQTVAQVRVHCIHPTAVDHVELSTGLSGNFQRRILVTPGGVLEYNIYADRTHRQIAGDGTQGTVVLAGPRRDNIFLRQQRFNLYGEIAGGQTAPAGDYVDVLRVTVVF